MQPHHHQHFRRRPDSPVPHSTHHFVDSINYDMYGVAELEQIKGRLFYAYMSFAAVENSHASALKSLEVVPYTFVQH